MKRTAENPYMATTSTTRTPLVKAEHDSTSSLPPPSKTTTPVRQEPQVVRIATNPPPGTCENLQFHQHQPHFSDKVTELRNLSTSLSSFLRRYDELHAHLDFIGSKLPVQNLNTDPSPPQSSSPVLPITTALAFPATEAAVAELPNSEPTVDNNESCLSEIESFCKSMSSRELYKYIVSHIIDVAKLREEAPAALRLAPNPAKLVLECLAYGKDSPRVEEREASVSILEFFLLMGCNFNEIEAAVKEEAEAVVVGWRNRVFNEDGGVKKGFEIHARGLLLLISCFGIPSVFKNEDVMALIQASNAIEISDSLRRSDVLLARIPGIVEEMMKKQMVVKAVDIVYTFGLESRYHPWLCLQNFLQQSRDTCMEERKVAHSDEAVNEANKKHLADLKSALKCLEDHKIDPFIGGWKIPNLISDLQKDVTLLDKKIRVKVTPKREAGEVKVTPKRQADEPESSKNLTSPEVKWTRSKREAGEVKVTPKREADEPESSKNLTSLEVKRTWSKREAGEVKVTPKREADESESSKNLTSPEVKRTRFSHNSYVDGRSSGEGLVPTNLLNGGILGYNSTFNASSSELHVLPTGPYPGPGVHGDMLVDGVGQAINNNGQPYGWHGNAPFRERLVGHIYANPAPSVGSYMGGMLLDNVGQVNSGYARPYGWHGDAPLRERVIGHSYPEPATSGVNGLFRVAPSMEGFVGLPNSSSIDTSNQRPDSGLYGFADSVN